MAEDNNLPEDSRYQLPEERNNNVLPELRATDTSQYSWRDRLREFAALKYGLTGERVAKQALGRSEEDLYLNYLQREYGTPDVGAGSEPLGSTPYPGSRPIRDMFNLQVPGGGLSDFGGLDAVLMSLSPQSGVAAAAETAALLGDAKGEYGKGNTGTAAFMGALAGVPLLLRYGNSIRNAPTPTPDRVPNPPDPAMPAPTPAMPGRREFLQNAGAMGGGIAGLSVLGGGAIEPLLRNLDIAPSETVARNTVVRSNIDMAPSGNPYAKIDRYFDVDIDDIKEWLNDPRTISVTDKYAGTSFSADEMTNVFGRQIPTRDLPKLDPETGRLPSNSDWGVEYRVPSPEEFEAGLARNGHTYADWQQVIKDYNDAIEEIGENSTLIVNLAPNDVSMANRMGVPLEEFARHQITERMQDILPHYTRRLYNMINTNKIPTFDEFSETSEGIESLKDFTTLLGDPELDMAWVHGAAETIPPDTMDARIISSLLEQDVERLEEARIFGRAQEPSNIM